MLSTRIRRGTVAAVAMLAGAALTVSAGSTGATSTSVLADRCPTGTCPGGPANSFTTDTLVLMADGAHKRIAEVTVGDRVAATDPRTGLRTAQPVVGVIAGTGIKDLVEITLDGGRVTATANHRFWVASRGGWQAAGDLQVGDLLADSAGAGAGVRVVGVSPTTRVVTVQNLDVAGPQTFQVQVGGHDVLVHE